MREERKRVVITGAGLITSLGNNVQETWRALINGESGLKPLFRFNPDKYGFPKNSSRIAGQVKNFDLKRWGIPKEKSRRIDPFVQYGLAASIEAVSWAEIDFEKEDPCRIGIQIGCSFGGGQVLEEQFRRFAEKGPERVSPYFIPMLIGNMVAGNINVVMNIKGPSSVVNTACASGTHAIGEACDKIRLGRADIMIAGGAEAALTPLTFSGFDQARTLSRRNEEPEKASRPFDKNRDGFVMAEGAGILILEELTHALERGAEKKILGEIVGFGATSDAYHITCPRPEGIQKAMELALEESGAKRRDIGYINAHGTSTLRGDASEAKAIRQFLVSAPNAAVCVGSTKSMTGHALGAAGGIEAAIIVLALRDRIIPPNLNLDNLDEECRGLNYVGAEALREKDFDYVLSNSCGFGGMNAALLIKRYVNK